SKFKTRWLAVFMMIFALGAFSGCQSAPKTTPENGNEIHGPPVPYGPLAGDPASKKKADETAPSYGPAARKIRPVVLVIGPGLARTFAAAGALRALVEEQIPIGAIYGVEMGALIASFYGFSGSINEFEKP